MADELTTETTETPATDAAAPPAEAEATPETTEAAEPEQPKQADASKLLAALTRKRAKQKAEGARLAQARVDLERWQATEQAKVSEAEQFRQLVARAKEGDDEALAALGIDYDDLTSRRLKRGTMSEEVGALKKQLEAERAARLEREKAAQEAQERAQAEHAVRAFVTLVQGGQYPETAMYDPQEIVQAGNAIAEQMAAANGGRYPDHAGIAAELERRLAAKHNAIRGKAPAPPPAAPAAKRGPSPTLTNRDSGDKPAKTRVLSEEEKERAYREWAAANLMSG
jgi:hypothetical protein